MTPHDPAKALREEIQGLVDIRATMAHKERYLQAEYGKIEVELGAVTKLRGFCDAELDRKRNILKALEEQK